MTGFISSQLQIVTLSPKMGDKGADEATILPIPGPCGASYSLVP